jgi:hypothetical protein
MLGLYLFNTLKDDSSRYQEHVCCKRNGHSIAQNSAGMERQQQRA